ncbi:MAG: hypothetical protein CML13_09480 [Puniceicoccaceae bacterium]|nr:hypothetical protein [Puniceicoccaceae bacterium]
MTATYSLPSSISSGDRFRSKPVEPNAIKVVIPTYQDWEGLRTTLDSLVRMDTPPSSIVVANDNPEPEIPGWVNSYPVEVNNYRGNRGPAIARNAGFGFLDNGILTRPSSELRMRVSSIGGRKERVTAHSHTINDLSVSQYGLEPRTFEWHGKEDWVYFTDCGCEHSPDLFSRFVSTWKEYGDSCVALSGSVLGSGKGAINEYMTEQGVLNPPLEQMINGVYIPQAIITANALVASLPFAYIGGFDTKFKE